LAAQFGRIDQRSVVREGEGSVHGFDEERLRIARGGCAHRRVTRMPDRLVAGQRGQGFGSENLREQADILVQAGPLSVGNRDARRFLSAVLQGEEPEESELRGLFAARRGDGDDAAFLARAVVAERSGECGAVFHDQRTASTPLRKSGRADPRSASPTIARPWRGVTWFSGCGIMPRTRPVESHTPAMASTEPLGFAG